MDGFGGFVMFAALESVQLFPKSGTGSGKDSAYYPRQVPEVGS
jgi:hypothetical protein